MRPFPKQNIRPSVLNGKKVWLELYGASPKQIDIHAVLNGVVYPVGMEPLQTSDYYKTWRLWDACPGEISRMHAMWKDDVSTLVSSNQFMKLDKYFTYTIEFLDPRTNTIISRRCMIRDRFKTQLILSVYTDDAAKCSCNKWHINGYNKTWRLWTGKPTAEQMGETPWTN